MIRAALSPGGPSSPKKTQRLLLSLAIGLLLGTAGAFGKEAYILTGYFPQAGFNPSLKPNNQRPAHGAIIARKLGPRGSVPPFVCLPKQHPSTGPAYLGAAAAP